MMAFLLVATQSGGQVGEIARTFGVDWPHLSAQIISFCIVCAVLYKFAYRPVLDMLDQRRQQIALGLANAERIKTELDRTEVQRQQVMAEAYAQAAKAIEEARVSAALLEERETQKAEAAAEQILERAREAAAQDQRRMLAELKREFGRLVVQASSTVTGKILTAEDQRRLAEDAARQIAG